MRGEKEEALFLELSEQTQSPSQRRALLHSIDLAITLSRDTGWEETASALETVRKLLVLYNAGFISLRATGGGGGEVNAT